MKWFLCKLPSNTLWEEYFYAKIEDGRAFEEFGTEPKTKQIRYFDSRYRNGSPISQHVEIIREASDDEMKKLRVKYIIQEL